MDNAWSHLPNAQHINNILGLVNKYPKEFSMAYDMAYTAACNAAYTAAYDAACDAACDAVCDAAYNEAYNAAYNAAYDVAYTAAYDAILAFIAYDDSTKYLQMTYDQLRIWAELSGNPAAILLLPYVKAIELIKAKT